MLQAPCDEVSSEGECESAPLCAHETLHWFLSSPSKQDCNRFSTLPPTPTPPLQVSTFYLITMAMVSSTAPPTPPTPTPQSTPERALEPFRFLDLPPELRCMVYEQLNIVTRRHVLSDSDVRQTSYPNASQTTDLSMTLLRKSLPVTLLTACQLVKVEAMPILATKLRELEKEPVRFQLSYGGATALTDPDSPFAGCFDTDSANVGTISNERVKDFVSRCSTYLTHTLQVPRDDAHKDHVELIVSTNSDLTEPHGNEVVLAIKRAFDLAVNTDLALMFTYLKVFPSVCLSLPSGEEEDFSGVDVGRLMHRFMAAYRTVHQVQASLRFKVVLGEEAWEGILEGGG